MTDTDTTPTEEPPDPIGAIHKRLAQLEEFVKHLVDKVEALFSVAAPAAAAVAEAVAPTSAAARVLEMIADAVPCPDHPKAPQTANGCTAEGCTFSPAKP